ncbi:hypothetical protein NDU88_000862 [Pleurodeles waltl]|uniref:Uncharacterized protein n=1 Tax=Pleurodeles waltl TaxID=8319 RepID=A0AAV7L7T1_PLEWA|nr:hypothetical protein NDU88_000862 [Pleurodeles waltl]
MRQSVRGVWGESMPWVFTEAPQLVLGAACGSPGEHLKTPEVLIIVVYELLGAVGPLATSLRLQAIEELIAAHRCCRIEETADVDSKLPSPLGPLENGQAVSPRKVTLHPVSDRDLGALYDHYIDDEEILSVVDFDNGQKPNFTLASSPTNLQGKHEIQKSPAVNLHYAISPAEFKYIANTKAFPTDHVAGPGFGKRWLGP